MLRMKWLAAALILIAVAAVLVPAATAGSSAQNDQGGGVAYALVNPTSGSPQLIAAHTSGFVAVSVGNAGQGDYCLTPAPGVDVVHTAAVASQEATYSNVLGSVLVRYPTGGSGSPINCPAGQLEVKTFEPNVSLTNQISFTVNVP